jgi:hypothetical protein
MIKFLPTDFENAFGITNLDYKDTSSLTWEILCERAADASNDKLKDMLIDSKEQIDNPDKRKILTTLSLVSTEDQLEEMYNDLALLGWRLKYRGHSGSWLGEPIYKLRKI